MNEQEEREYYERSERELRSVNHNSSRRYPPSIETSTPHRRPYNNGHDSDGCRLFALIFFVAGFGGLGLLVIHFL